MQLVYNGHQFQTLELDFVGYTETVSISWMFYTLFIQIPSNL